MASKITFPRQQAGEYNVIENGKYVGLIQKLNASKWAIYFCSNPAIKGNPKKVEKTLKDCKTFCERYFESSDSSQAEMNENSPELDNLLNSVRKSPNPDVKEMTEFKKKLVAELQQKEEEKEKNATAK